MKVTFIGAASTALAAVLSFSAIHPSAAADHAYHFVLAGQPKPEGHGKNIVAVQLLRDGKPIPGAIISRVRADMGPMHMAAMTAPVRPLGERPPGTYRFEVTNGPVWNKPDNWAVSFTAQPKGAEPMTGSVTVKLAP